MIWISRRNGRRSRAPRPASSVPRNRIEPELLSTMRITVWAVLVLPQPDSPTSATISPSPTENETPSTAWTVSRGRRCDRAEDPARDRVLRDQILDLEQWRRGGRRDRHDRHEAALIVSSLRWQSA